MATSDDPNTHQVGGTHYRAAYQHWDLVADTGMNYFEAQITKYVTRWRQKNGTQDVQKAIHYCEKLFALYQQNRLPLPVTTRRLWPWPRFVQAHALGELETAIFVDLLMYTTLQQLQAVRQALGSLLQQAVEQQAQPTR